MRVGSLFSGIGGLDLACEMVGLGQIVWQVEVDPACRRVLAEQWPGLPIYGNVSEIDWSEVEPVDVLCGGFPCPDFSLAGKREGGDGERNLWPEFYRAIRELQPELVVIENVLSADAGSCDAGQMGPTCARAGPASGSICRTCWRPLDNQSADTLWFFDCFLRSLAEAGFDAEWRCVRASDVGACHKRERCFIVATPTDAEQPGEPADGGVRRGVPSSWHQPERAAVPAGPEVAFAADALSDRADDPDADSERERHEPEPDLGEEQPGQPAPRRSDAGRLGAASADARSSRRERREAAPDRVDIPDGHEGGRHKGTGEPEGRAQHAADAEGSGPGGQPAAGHAGEPAVDSSARDAADASGAGRQGAGPAEPAGGSEPADGGGPDAADAEGDEGRLGDGDHVRAGRGALGRGQAAGRGQAPADAERSGLGEGAGLRPDGEGGFGGGRPGDERDEDDDGPAADWSAFGPAIERWESIVGRGAPAPTLVGSSTLNPAFVEWMMGFPEGWVAGLNRTNALKALGNAVVPLQGAAAICELLSC